MQWLGGEHQRTTGAIPAVNFLSYSSVGVREHTMSCTSNSQYLLTRVLEVTFSLQRLFRVGISSVLSVLRWLGVLNS